MLAQWFIYAVAATSLVAAAALATEQLLAVWRQPRRGVWLVALVASTALPVLLAARGRIPEARRSVSAPPPNSAIASRAVRPRLVDARAVIARRAEPLFDDSRLTRLWCLGSAALLALFVTAATRLRRESRRWRSERLNGVGILVAPTVGPAVVGFVRPRIVLPEWALSLDAASRELILRHELEHVRARDPYLLLVAAMSVIVLPWNFALWFVARRLTLAVELDCDRRVLSAGGSVREYGRLLLDVVSRRNARGLLLGASFIQPRRFLARRISSMVTNTPRRPRLISLALATAAALLTVAAMRLPTPAPLRLRWIAERSEDTHTPIRQRAASEASRPEVVSPLARAHTRAGPVPRITAVWENAPIELVVAAFAEFSGKRISIGPDVNGLVTARITDEPWDEALAHVMRANGYRVVVHPDSSITVSMDRGGPPQGSPNGGEVQNRPVFGSAIDASTNLPIPGVTVNVAGLQAIGEPNRTCTTAGGTFKLKVPDGDVWLDASAPGYEFSRVTLGPHDAEALFRGRRTRTRIADTLDGRTRPHQIVNLSAPHFWLPVANVTWRATPLYVINGVVITDRELDSPPGCVGQ